MKNIILKISIFPLVFLALSGNAFAYEMYGGENVAVLPMQQPVALNYHFYTENSPAVTVNGSQYPASQTTASAGSYNASYSSNRNSIEAANSQIKPVNATVNKFLPKNNGEWFIVVVIVLAMFAASKFLIKAKKKPDSAKSSVAPKDDKKPLAKIA